MNKSIIEVPKGIRYISQWKEFSLPEYPCIINKQITGCGFTEWCIINEFPVILCSPRKILLHNKEEQHPGEVYYARNLYEKTLGVDEDLKSKRKQKQEINVELTKDSIIQFKQGVKDYYIKTSVANKPPKILVTYDSFRLVKEVLESLGVLDKFLVIVDEFQSIFTDSRFKADSEIEFISFLQNIKNLYYVSATPMMDKYLEDIPEFKDLEYLELDWKTKDPNRIDLPNIIPIPYRGSLVSIASDIINDYKQGKFEKDCFKNENEELVEIESREVVIFVNSVNNICDIIKSNSLSLDNCNVLCADTESNKEKVRKAFGLKYKKDIPEDFLRCIPKNGDVHKQFTLCTKTAYLGADFYSTNARTIILSDGNIECLAVDISLDLPQILGRQRLKCNPWKNCAELYFKVGMGTHEISEEEFEKLIEQKVKNTELLLESYKRTPKEGKSVLANVYLGMIGDRYRDNYIGIHKHSGSDIEPVFNNLVKISERRAFDLQQKEYYSQFTVLSEIGKQTGEESVDFEILKNFILEFSNKTTFIDKMKFLCMSIQLNEEAKDKILKLIPKEFKNYYTILGPNRISSLKYRRSNLKEEYENLKFGQENKSKLVAEIYSTFNLGERYTRNFIKDTITDIYSKLKIIPTIKIQSTDIEKYFEVERTKISNKETGKRDEGFKLIKKKL